MGAHNTRNTPARSTERVRRPRVIALWSGRAEQKLEAVVVSECRARFAAALACPLPAVGISAGSWMTAKFAFAGE